MSFAHREVRDALKLFHTAERLGYDEDSCRAWRWQCWMLLGEFERAWAESDALIARGTPDANRLWDGLPFTGNRVIVRCLHGYGDAIQFLRYAPLVRASAAHLTVETHPEMVSLVQQIPGIDQVITWDRPASASGENWNQQIEVMEASRARSELQSKRFPARYPTLVFAVTMFVVFPAAVRRKSVLFGPRVPGILCGLFH